MWQLRYSCGRQALNGDIRNLSSPQIAIHKDATASAGYVIHAIYPYDSDGARRGQFECLLPEIN